MGADMAMSEQYLRTKQAMLKAKKREQEMKIAQKMAELREEEVIKMREKFARMQELLSSRKTELKITEEIIHEKDGEKENLEKLVPPVRFELRNLHRHFRPERAYPRLQRW